MATLTSQSRNILGPLTKTYTQPPQCTYAVAQCSDCLVAWSAQECVSTGAQDATSCWPPTTAGVPSPTPTLFGWGFYSPGIVCPSGFTSACSATASGSSGWDVQFRMTIGETAVGCCPPGYSCANINGGTCTVVPTSTVVPTVTCQSGTSGAFGQLTLPTQGLQGDFTLFAPLIQINWRSQDRPSSTSSGPSAPASASPEPGGSSGGLGSGAIAGIAVGAAVVVIAAAGALFWWIRKRRRDGPAYEAALQDIATRNDDAGRKELPGNYAPVHEMPSHDVRVYNPVELPTEGGRYEVTR